MTENRKFKVKDSDTIYTLKGALWDQYEITWVNSSGEDRQDLKDRSFVTSQFYKGEWYYLDGNQQQEAEHTGGSVSALDKQVSGNHYKDCGIQPIEYIHANNLSYFQGNVIKYVTRYKDKAGKADLEKAIHYLELMVELEYPDAT